LEIDAPIYLIVAASVKTARLVFFRCAMIYPGNILGVIYFLLLPGTKRITLCVYLLATARVTSKHKHAAARLMVVT
jgi:hypothetical protein